MFLASIVIVFALSQSGAASQAATPQPAQQESMKPEATSAPQQSENPPAATSKPCPSGAKQESSPAPDCVPRKKKKGKPPKPEATSTTDAGLSKTVVRNGSTAEPSMALAPSVNEQQASRESQQTSQLLASTEANLKTVSSRTLSASQQDTVQQIKNYMEQARAAQNEGDLQRAYNLANKAKMLSADLVGH